MDNKTTTYVRICCKRCELSFGVGEQLFETFVFHFHLAYCLLYTRYKSRDCQQPISNRLTVFVQ
jgi:hypothetical protein